MADTSIEWTNKTWNPVRGCSRVSAGCDNCYAMRFAHRYSAPGQPFAGLTTIRKGKIDWAGQARFIPDHLADPLRWRNPQRVFVNSMSDLFHRSLTNEQIAAVFGIMGIAKKHTYQVLTKQVARALEWFEWIDDGHESADEICRGHADLALIEAGLSVIERNRLGVFDGTDGWPLSNVWLGVSVENNDQMKRIHGLLECPAAIRFVSAEPLIGPIELEPYLHEPLDPPPEGQQNTKLDWVIVGGESGNGARPFDVSWARNIVHDCAEADVACFVKQLGKRPFDSSVNAEASELSHDPATPQQRLERFATAYAVNLESSKGSDPNEWEPYLRVRKFPEVRP